MNIVILSHYAGSENMGKRTRHFYLAKEWVEMGHSVTIIAASFSHLRSVNPFVKEDFQKIVEDGIEYRFVDTPLYTISNSLKKKNIFNFVYGTWKNANNLADELKPDIVICASSYALDIYPAIKMAKRANAKLIYEITCLLPLYMIDIYGYEKKDAIVKFINAAQKKAIAFSDAVISSLPFADKYLNEQGLEPKKYHYVSNGSDLNEIKQCKAPKHITIIKRFKDQGKFTVVYLGGLEFDNSLQDFVVAAGKCPKSMFVLVGNGMERLRLKKLAFEKGITNVDFIDKVPRNGVISALGEADCLYVGTKKSEIYDYGIGIDKLFDYMASGRPIICGIKTKEDTLEKAGCALIIEPESSEAIAEAVIKMSSMTEEERSTMGENGRKYCEENFNYNKLAKEYINILESMPEEEKAEET